MNTNTANTPNTTTPQAPQQHWYVGHCLNFHERKSEAYLQSRGVECFLPVQRQQHKWSDRLKWVDEFLMRGIIFVHCTNTERLLILQERSMSKIQRFMVEHIKPAATPKKKGTPQMIPAITHRPQVIPEAQMETFMAMIRQNEAHVTLAHQPLAQGDWVQVTRGDLVGLKFELVKIEDGQCLVTRINGVGTFYITVDQTILQKISKDTPIPPQTDQDEPTPKRGI